MTVPEYREQAQKAALRVGPTYLKTYVIYVVVSALFLFLSLQMQQRVLDWQETVQQFLSAGDPNLPAVTPELWGHFVLALILIILAQVLRAGWYSITLNGVRGQPFSWRDLPSQFSRIHKVFVISFLRELGCLVGLFLFID